ncbi:expressed unknown protein [Seminavis robusta]|uniref:Uncharacterized protein n=1 Tax=Seminavis robusta TaxID=568900 RepID=A0A9N8HXP5_9STRA|nr:expressed unknown protein [Seminavis robusta]|eukprot:Sro2566_g331440.1 n/a (526) ;mRNA; f:4148-5725
MPQQQQEGSFVLTAALKGLGCYTFLVLVIIHLFVAWKWETTVLEDFVLIEYYNDPLPTPPKAIKGGPSEDSLMDFLQDTQQEIKNYNDDDTADQVDKIFKEFQSTLRNWEYWDDNKDKDNTTLLPDGRKSLKIVGFIKILKKASLSEMETDDGLSAAFKVALREFQGLAEHRSEVQWDIIQKLLLNTEGQEEFPDKQVISQDDLYEELCRLAPLPELELLLPDDDDEQDTDAVVVQEEEEDEQDEDNETETYADEDHDNIDTSIYLAEDDLNMHYQMLEAILEKRSDNIRDYWQLKGNASIEAALTEAIAIVKQDLEETKMFTRESIRAIKDDQASLLVAHANTNDKVEEPKEKEELEDSSLDTSQCDSAEEVQQAVLVLMKAGLDAIHRKTNIQTAILDKYAKIVPEAKDVPIFENDEQLDEVLPEMTPQMQVNIRKIIDTPLLRHSSVALDWVLDWVLMYTDKLEKEIDKLALPANMETASTGELLVAYLLQTTGKQPLPIPPEVHQVIVQSERGKNFLSTYS